MLPEIGESRELAVTLKKIGANYRERPEMHRILLLLSETCLPDFFINPIGKNFCSFAVFINLIVFNPIDNTFVY